MTAKNAIAVSRDRTQDEFGVPAVPGWFQDGFHRFLKPYLRRHFHAIAIDHDSRNDSRISDGESLLLFGNHPSWWDPLIAHFLNKTLFPGRQFYAPIDAAALENYRVFEKLGFYGVRMNTTAGAASFLKRSNAILDAPRSALWLTPEGRFTDPRDHGESLMPGLSHLCSRRNIGTVMSFALEYVFWDERLPVCLVRLGEPIRLADHTEMTKPDWNHVLTKSMRDSQRNLAKLAIARSSEPLDDLLAGVRGAGGTYDLLRRMKSLVTGKKFRAQHGEQFR